MSSEISFVIRYHGGCHHVRFVHRVADGKDILLPDLLRFVEWITIILCTLHKPVVKVIQIGVGTTGHGYSVLDVVNAFMKVNGVNVPYVIKPRRPGDIATCYCDPAKAKAELGWEAQYGIEEMCRDSWNWQKNNPKGY